jgi:UTP-glucose-1-phosphate uridylyltransferase
VLIAVLKCRKTDNFKLPFSYILIPLLTCGKRYDVGDKLGMVEANIEMGLKHPQIGAELKQYLIDLVAKF